MTIDYAIAGGPPDNWQELEILLDGRVVDEPVYEASVAGWIMVADLDEHGKLQSGESGETILYKRVEGKIEIRVREDNPSFQRRVGDWIGRCFGPIVARDKVERNHRFLEEALELVQACDATKEDCHALVDYVFGRPTGELRQEIGGVMVTLAALCQAHGMDMELCGEVELKRILQPEIMEKIRAKQAAKPKLGGPLP